MMRLLAIACTVFFNSHGHKYKNFAPRSLRVDISMFEIIPKKSKDGQAGEPGPRKVELKAGKNVVVAVKPEEAEKEMTDAAHRLTGRLWKLTVGEDGYSNDLIVIIVRYMGVEYIEMEDKSTLFLFPGEAECPRDKENTLHDDWTDPDQITEMVNFEERYECNGNHLAHPWNFGPDGLQII